MVRWETIKVSGCPADIPLFFLRHVQRPKNTDSIYINTYGCGPQDVLVLGDCACACKLKPHVRASSSHKA